MKHIWHTDQWVVAVITSTHETPRIRGRKDLIVGKKGNDSGTLALGAVLERVTDDAFIEYLRQYR